MPSCQVTALVGGMAQLQLSSAASLSGAWHAAIHHRLASSQPCSQAWLLTLGGTPWQWRGGRVPRQGRLARREVIPLPPQRMPLLNGIRFCDLETGERMLALCGVGLLACSFLTSNCHDSQFASTTAPFFTFHFSFKPSLSHARRRMIPSRVR
jgi:hypothetical protein